MWFKSYLSDRSQYVIADGAYSDSTKLYHEVPQGSCLGPLLFTIYASKLFEVVKACLPIAHAYADDCQLYLFFQPDSGLSETEAIASMERSIKAVRAWMLKDKLKLNEEKTELLVIGTRQQLDKVSLDEMTIGHTKVKTTTTAKSLGVWFDCNMKSDTNITKIFAMGHFYL